VPNVLSTLAAVLVAAALTPVSNKPSSFRTLSLPCASIFHLYKTAVIPKALPQNSAGSKNP